MPKTADSSRSERRRAQLAERRSERRERAHPKWVGTALGVAFLLSGAAGLVHERLRTLWPRWSDALEGLEPIEPHEEGR